MEERAQGQFEMLLIAVVVVTLAAGTALYIKTIANSGAQAVQQQANDNTNN